MTPILYNANERDFDHNGIGALSGCVSATAIWSRNGEMELELVYPMDGIHFDEIKLRRIILAAPDQQSRAQPYRVYDISKPLDGLVTVYARHVAYDLMGIVDQPYTAASVTAALNGLRTNAVTDCPFDFWTDKDTVAKMEVSVPTSAWELLGGTQGGILDTYGGEYEFDRWTVKLHKQRGYDRGVAIRYGKNMTSLTQDQSCEAVYTGVYPFWADVDGNIVQLDDRIVSAPGSYGFTRIYPLDLSAEWEDEPTKDQLKARAERYIKDNNIGVPKVSLSVAFYPLDQSEDYQGIAMLEQVGPCDTVTVEFPRLGVSAVAECVGIKYDVLSERYDELEIGDARTTLADTIVAQGQEIQQRPSDSTMRAAVMQLTAAILGASGGAVRLLDTNNDGMPDELYIADNDDPAKAKKVWRWNYAGWGASSNGYNGPFTLGATLEGGIVADFITAGTLNASLIRAGVLTDTKGKNYWDMSTGEFRLAATTTVGGDTVDSIADSAASSAISDYDTTLTQQKVFDRLTNRGQVQGIYLQDGRVYINGTYIKTGDVDAKNVSLSGAFTVYQNQGGIKGGTVGYMRGSTGTRETDGIGVADATGNCYIIATDAGVRMQSGVTRLYTLNDGTVCVDGNLKVTGSVTEYATL